MKGKLISYRDPIPDTAFWVYGDGTDNPNAFSIMNLAKGIQEVIIVVQQFAEQNKLILAEIYADLCGVDWIIDQNHCHPNDLGHRLIANCVFEAVVRNCSFVAWQMPTTSLIQSFSKKYGNGPDRPSDSGITADVMLNKVAEKKK